MLSPLDFAFWQAVLPPICVLTLPIAVITSASILRSAAAGTVIYLLIFIAELIKMPTL